MMGGQRRWPARVVLLWGLLLLVSGGGGQIPTLAEAKAPRGVRAFSDLEQFRQELNSSGALKFYDTTEELVRAAQFEKALMRYRFLKGQIAGQAAYGPLTAQIDRRLRFLKQELRLSEHEISGLQPAKRRKVRRRRVGKKVVSSSPSPEAVKKAALGEGKAEPADKPAAVGASPQQGPPASAGGPAATTPETPSSGPAAATPAEAVPKPEAAPKAGDKVQEDKPPPPPASTWQKIREKIRKRLFSSGKKED